MSKKTLETNRKILDTIENYNNNGKLTIAIFCDAYYPAVDGVIKVFENQAMRLCEKNNVIVCVPKHKGKILNNKPYLVLGCNSISASSVGYDLGLPTTDKFFNKAIKLARIDIVHFHSPFTMGSFAVKLAKKRKIPAISTFHSEYKQDFYKATKNKAIANILTKSVVKVFNQCDMLLTMNNYAAGVIRDYGYKGDISIVSNSIGFKIHDDVDDLMNNIRIKYNIDKDTHVFSFIGRLVVEKNILFIADVLKVLKERNIKFKMFYIGKGVDANKLKKRVKDNDLNNEVIFTGSIQDEKEKSALLKVSELFIFPTTYDTDGIVKIEAACAEVPTICVENTGNSSTITDNVNGFISKLDVNIFADRIIKEIANKNNLINVGKRAKKDLYFTWEEIVSKIENIYEQAINKKKIERIKKAREYKLKNK